MLKVVKIIREVKVRDGKDGREFFVLVHEDGTIEFNDHRDNQRREMWAPAGKWREAFKSSLAGRGKRFTILSDREIVVTTGRR